MRAGRFRGIFGNTFNVQFRPRLELFLLIKYNNAYIMYIYIYIYNFLNNIFHVSQVEFEHAQRDEIRIIIDLRETN